MLDEGDDNEEEEEMADDDSNLLNESPDEDQDTGP